MKLESIVLNEGIAEVKANYPKIEDDDFYAIIKADPTYVEGQDRVGTYGKWLLNLYNKKNLKIEDLYKATEYLNEFEKKKKGFKNKDIGQFKSLPDLFNALKEVGEVELSDRQKERKFKKDIKNADLNADVILETDKWIMYTPNDYDTSCKLSSNTEWCTGISSKGNDYYYNYYTKDGPLYILHNKEDEDDKYQFHFETGQFKDSSDAQINPFEVFKDDEEIINFIKEKVLDGFRKELGIDKDTPDDAIVTYKIPKDELYGYIEEYKPSYRSRDSLDGDWITSFLEDPYDNFYYEGYRRDLSEALYHCCDDIDDDNFEKLKQLGCKANSKDELHKLRYDEDLFPEEVYDDVEDALSYACDDGDECGAISSCERDIISAIEEVFEPLKANYTWDETEVSGTKKQWEDLILHCYTDGDIDWYYDEFGSLSDVFELLFRDDFDLVQPYYGWDGFDEEAFNDRLDDLLSEIEYEPTQEDDEDDDTNESLKESKVSIDGEVERVYDILKKRFEEAGGYNFKRLKDATDGEFEISNKVKESNKFWTSLIDKLNDNGINLHTQESSVAPNGDWYYYVYLTKRNAEGLKESMNEDIEKHDTLNPLLWNADNTLKDEVREKLMQIADEFIKGLEEDGIKMDVDDIKIVGSNCSYNYTKDSDIDLHIIAKNVEAPQELYALLYSAYRSIWNKNYDIDFYGIPVEIFVETPELVDNEITTIDVEG